jgi:hypothetical protein
MATELTLEENDVKSAVTLDEILQKFFDNENGMK